MTDFFKSNARGLLRGYCDERTAGDEIVRGPSTAPGQAWLAQDDSLFQGRFARDAAAAGGYSRTAGDWPPGPFLSWGKTESKGAAGRFEIKAKCFGQSFGSGLVWRMSDPR